MLLEAFRSSNSQNAWAEFLQSYSGVLYQTARGYTSDEDAAADCYLYICEQLSRNHFRRLLKFKPEGSAAFTTWLRVVARNLCFDWHRARSGRPRPFKAFQRLSPLELEVYTCRFERGLSQEETLQRLEVEFPGVSLTGLATIEAQLQGSLSSRQHWIMSARRQSAFSTAVTTAGDEAENGSVEVADTRPDPEVQVADREQQACLEKCLASLPAEERLIIQLRFEQDLSLDEIAGLCGLGGAQRVHRRIAAILKKLRGALQ